MALRKIARLGEPVLRAVAEEVPPHEIGTEAFQRFLDDMVDTCRDAEGVGLAAPQIFEGRRVFVIEVRNAGRYPGVEAFPLLIAINPELECLGAEQSIGGEGCLSIPGLRGLVSRHRSVRLKGLDRQGKPFDRVLEGFPAVIAQHEFDHLNGIVFLDRMETLLSLAFETEWVRARARGG